MHPRKVFRAKPLVAASVTAALVAGLNVTSPAAASPAGGNTLARYHHQRVDWTNCQEGAADEVGKELDAAGAQCARVLVPLDYTRPHGRAITVAISRLKATDTEHRIGAMLINGGGPGGGSIDLPPLLRALMEDVGPRYDLVGMDPRSSGRSTPVDCGWRTGTWLRSAGFTRDSFDDTVAYERDLAARCWSRHPDLLSHISTRNTARDMDVVRAVLGEEEISYYGASYGTYLGAVYTQMFARRADRFILDSAIDPTRYGGEKMLADATPANEAALHHWAAWAARHDGDYHLGATQRAVLATVERIIRAAAQRPLRVGGYRVDEHVVPYILFDALDDDRDEPSANLAAAVRVLETAADGDRVVPTPELKDILDFVLTSTDSPYGSSQVAVLCGDRSVFRDPDAYWRRIQGSRTEQPVMGPLLKNIGPCAFWPQPRERPTEVHNDVPALIVAATGDTRTIYQHGQALHHLLTGSRLVTLNARIHAVYPRYGNACINDAVNDYLRTGSLPPTDTIC
jgi:pimeloyl-ACP methyl ester carboxylesterase